MHHDLVFWGLQEISKNYILGHIYKVRLWTPLTKPSFVCIFGRSVPHSLFYDLLVEYRTHELHVQSIRRVITFPLENPTIRFLINPPLPPEVFYKVL